MLLEESNKHRDMHMQPLKGGMSMGLRFLYHMVWATHHYDFKYFVRLDDDYFWCMRRFLSEMPHSPPQWFHWGYLHCVKGIVRPEESSILLTRDVVNRLIGQDPNQMKCHKVTNSSIANAYSIGIITIY